MAVSLRLGSYPYALPLCGIAKEVRCLGAAESLLAPPTPRSMPGEVISCACSGDEVIEGPPAKYPETFFLTLPGNEATLCTARSTSFSSGRRIPPSRGPASYDRNSERTQPVPVTAAAMLQGSRYGKEAKS